MKETEVVKMMAIIRSNYPNFENTREKLSLWSELMENLPLETALSNLKEYMAQSPYPPVASDIIRHDPNQLMLQAQNQQELEIAIEEAFRDWVVAGNEPERFVYKP